ncbi:hypothetical protein P3T25_009464 [Paraburkholderia sp. GAS32]
MSAFSHRLGRSLPDGDRQHATPLQTFGLRLDKRKQSSHMPLQCYLTAAEKLGVVGLCEQPQRGNQRCRLGSDAGLRPSDSKFLFARFIWITIATRDGNETT